MKQLNYIEFQKFQLRILMFIYRFVATKTRPSGPIELPSGTLLNYNRVLQSNNCTIAWPEWIYGPSCFSLYAGQFKAPDDGYYLFFVSAPVFYHDAQINEYAQAAIDFIWVDQENSSGRRIIVRSYFDSVSNTLRQTQRSLTGFFAFPMRKGAFMYISNRYEKTIAVGPWQFSITLAVLQLSSGLDYLDLIKEYQEYLK